MYHEAVEGMRSQDSLRLEVAPLEMELTATQLDSSNAAAALAEIGAACIVTMGGDGTNRMVAKSRLELGDVGPGHRGPQRAVGGQVAGQHEGGASRHVD